MEEGNKQEKDDFKDRDKQRKFASVKSASELEHYLKNSKKMKRYQ